MEVERAAIVDKDNLGSSLDGAFIRVFGQGELEKNVTDALLNFTHLTKHLCDVPIAFLALKHPHYPTLEACVGIQPDGGVSTFAFSVADAFGSPLGQIPDALKDARFKHHERVIDSPKIRFYAGLPLRTQGGQIVGILGVIDSRPRILNTREHDGLVRLGQEVLRALDQHHEARQSQARSVRQHTLDGDTSHQRLQQIADHVPGMFFQAELPKGGKFLLSYASEGVVDIFGLSPHDIAQHTDDMLAIIHDDDRPAFISSIEQSAYKQSRWQHEFRVIHPIKGLIWIGGNSRPQLQNDGSILWHGVLADISQRKLQQAELDKHQEMNRRLLEALSEAVISCNAQGELTLFNDTAREWHGADIRQIPVEHWGKLYDIYEADGITPMLNDRIPLLRALRGEHVRDFEISIAAIGQPVRFVVCNADPLHTPEGELLGAVVVMHDITERKRIESMQREFVSTVSHELRTPLTSISGSLGLIKGGVMGGVPESMTQMLDIAYQNSLRLSHLINDLLDIDKLVAGKMNFDLQLQALHPLLQNSIDSNLSYAHQHKVELVLLDEVPCSVRVDDIRFQQVLANFLSNAIKFSTPQSQVYVVSEQKEDKVRISVVDHGTGIPREFHQHIFQKFSQADGSDSRRKGGTGLGLSISKELVERMDGQIGFSSVEAQGSTFWLELPAQPLGDVPASDLTSLRNERVQLNRNEKAGMPRVLHVEDDTDLCKVISHLGKDLADFIPATSLAEARQYLAKMNFNLILLDLTLPDGNGLELLEELHGRYPGLPVVVLSAQELPIQQRSVVDASLAKSRTDAQHFVNLLRRLLPARRG